MDFPTRYDWDSFFRDAKDMNDTVPGERPDTIRLEGLPCRWFTLPDGPPDRPSEMALQTIFQVGKNSLYTLPDKSLTHLLI
jgi:arginine/serine-rich splicing factor 17